MDILEEIKQGEIPKHIAIIMDGNGRWAKEQGKKRIFGHHNAIEAVRASAEGCAEAGVKCLTLYAFSTENWNRPKLEVTALMELLIQTIKQEVTTLNKNSIRLKAIGDIESLPKRCQKQLLSAIEETKDNKQMDLILALSYSSRWEILNATKEIAEKVATNELTSEEINEKTFSEHLSTKHWPDPELMIRTSGEYRISNFLLWQLAYAELHFLDKYWPDFRKPDLFEAIKNFQHRERRFGKTSAQIKA